MPVSSLVLGQPIFMQFTDLLGIFTPYGKMYIYDWDTREPVVTYSDPEGNTPQSNPIIMDGIGRLPMTWFVNGSYYIETKTANDTDVFQTPQPYIPGDGGGAIIDEALLNDNLFINGQLYFYTQTSYTSPIPTLIDSLAPDAWGWRHDGTNASDSLTFIPFALDDASFSPPAINYLNYTSPLAGANETKKDLYYRIPSVRSLENEEITVLFETESGVAGNFQLTVLVNQYFGTGGSPSSTVTTTLGAVALDTDWQQLSVTGVIPSLTGTTVGSNEDDYLEIFIRYPLNTAQNINITNLYWKRGGSVEGYPYKTPQQEKAIIDALNGSFSTGDEKLTYKNVPDAGWIMANDGTIGSATSGATNRANPDTFDLYSLFWNNISDAACPVSGGRGANAAADFAANKTIRIPLEMGRYTGTAGSGSGLTPRALGSTVGAETHVQSLGELRSHTHSVVASGGSANAVATTDPGTAGGTANFGDTGNAGASDPMNIMNPGVFKNCMIKL